MTPQCASAMALAWSVVPPSRPRQAGGPRDSGFCPAETVQENLDGRLDPLTDLVVARSITHHGAMEQIEADHVVEQRCRLMRVAASQTPSLLLLLDKLSNDAPRCLRAALEPSAPECRKA